MNLIFQVLRDRSGGPALGIISTIFSIGSSLFGGKDKAPAAAPTVLADPTSEPKVRDAQDRARRRRASSVGRRGTILTSPLGLTGDDNVARPSLLGQ